MMINYTGNEIAKNLNLGTFIVSDKLVSENNIKLIDKHKNDIYFVEYLY